MTEAVEKVEGAKASGDRLQQLQPRRRQRMIAGKSAGGRTIDRQVRRAGMVDGNGAVMTRRTFYGAEKEKRKRKGRMLRFIFCKEERA